MAKRIRNLHESEITTTGNDIEMGRRYLGATELHYGAYIYNAPETGLNYIVEAAEVEELGRIIYAITEKTTGYLVSGEEKTYANPDGEGGLCDCGYAYSIWCTRHGEETDQELPE